jgi:MerR family transcriptional regulator, light-induced transcriptional regulator
MNSFTIKDLENLSGIKAHTIRIWEQRYKFLKPCRTCTNIRYYSNEELQKILGVALLNKYGYKISHIDKMCDKEMKEKMLSLSPMEARQQKIVNDLILSMVNLDSQNVERIIDNYITTEGIERTITQIIFPLLDRTGIIWLTNRIDPLQEKLLSNVVRQKLMVALEAMPAAAKTTKTIVLFTPEGTHRDLGILYMNYILRKRGTNTIYLGANVPLDDIVRIATVKNPDYIYCHLASFCRNFNLDAFITSASEKIKSNPFIVSGKLITTYEGKLSKNISLIETFPAVIESLTNSAK